MSYETLDAFKKKKEKKETFSFNCKHKKDICNEINEELTSLIRYSNENEKKQNTKEE